ncbi:MAG: hypothetical protein E7612_04525 [Ruminococcaceae bacterium]|nr:hypothetical protein [Oscillospiraceae bacterium]
MNDGQMLDEVNESLQNKPKEIDTSANEAPIETESAESTADGEDGIDYALVVSEDLRILREEFPELSEIEDICELNDPLRYAALRDLGLSPEEAYLATSKRQKKDNRSHLFATKTVSVSRNGAMSDSELAAAREIFTDISDREIRKLYKRVTK